MSGRLTITDPGPMTTVQDRGRFGFQGFGVPVSGALDPGSLALANALVGNAPDAPALESRYAGPAFRLEAEGILVALAGTEGVLAVTAPDGTRSTVPACRSVRLAAGSAVAVRPAGASATWYVAISGSFDLAPVLGSASTYARGGFGGFHGRVLEAGDELPLRPPAERRPERAVAAPAIAAPGRIRVVLGPQADHFTEEAIERFLGSEWAIGTQADRMGARLEGPALEHRHGHDIVSDGTVAGSIQVPGSRQPIVLLSDRQTTGGYPKIATVISADLAALGRARAGQRLRFSAVSPGEAAKARREWRRRQDALLRSIAAASAGTPDPALLYTVNLISGVYGDPGGEGGDAGP